MLAADMPPMTRPMNSAARFGAHAVARKLKNMPIIGQKVIKPAPADPFPDSVVLHKDQLQKPAVQKSAKKSGVNRLMLIAVIAAVGLYAAYEVSRRRG